MVVQRILVVIVAVVVMVGGFLAGYVYVNGRVVASPASGGQTPQVVAQATLSISPTFAPATELPTQAPPADTATPTLAPPDTVVIEVPTATAESPSNTPATATATPSPASSPTQKRRTPTLVPATAMQSVADEPTSTSTSTSTASKTPTAEAASLPTQGQATSPTSLAAAGGPTVVNGVSFDAYIPAATKTNQYYHFTCEFDAAWVVFKTYGIDAAFADEMAAIGQDTSVEPQWEDAKTGSVTIYGGDISNYYSGDYKTNFLARTTGQAMRKVFEHYGLTVTPVHDKAGIEAALSRGELVWIKATADFKPGRDSIWIEPNGAPALTDSGQVYHTVLGNDHAVVLMGYNSTGVEVRDVLGPTSTNESRKYEYLVPWAKFLTIWAEQSNDGLAVRR